MSEQARTAVPEAKEPIPPNGKKRRGLLVGRPMVAWFIVAVAATVISAWIINPPKEWLTWLIQAGGSVDQLTLKLLVVAGHSLRRGFGHLHRLASGPRSADRLRQRYEHPQS